jgi:hypothetical protein
LDVVQQSYQKKGFSEQTASKMARAQKSSTLSVYQGKWNVFSSWCVERGSDPLDATSPLVADFLCFLRDKPLAISTIEGYRTALSKVLKAHKGLDIGKDTAITRLIADFQREAPARNLSVPSWDLSLVLNMLTKSPFEPMHLSDIKFFSFKTVFLLALASGRRRSELHALQYDIQRTENWSEVSLFPDSQFVAKTQLVAEGAAVLKPLTLPALTKVVGPDLIEDRSLCVVRAVKYYLSRTKEIRKGRQRFFISIKKGHQGDISKNPCPLCRSQLKIGTDHGAPDTTWW